MIARASSGRSAPGVLVHQMGQELLVEGAPVGADAHGLAVADRHLDDGAELPVLLVLEADIARIDAVLVERLGAGRMIGQELMADVVEVADERDGDAEPVEALADLRHGGGRLVPVDGDAHDLGAGAGQGRDLGHRGVHVGRVGVGHRLDDDRGAAADHDGPDPHADGPMARRGARPGLLSGSGREVMGRSRRPTRRRRRLAEGSTAVRQARSGATRSSARPRHLSDGVRRV